jgi:hypothetical protein
MTTSSEIASCSQNEMPNVIHFGKQVVVVRKKQQKYWSDSNSFLLLRLKTYTYMIFHLVFYGFELHFRIVMLIMEFE